MPINSISAVVEEDDRVEDPGKEGIVAEKGRDSEETFCCAAGVDPGRRRERESLK